MNRDERRRARDRFFAIYDGLPSARIGTMLGCSERTVDRLAHGETIPVQDIAERMVALADEIRRDAQLSEAERLERDERRRADHERRQRRHPLTIIDAGELRDVPSWFARMRQLMIEGHYDQARDLAWDRVHEEEDFARIAARTQPYVLGSFALACYYTGRNVEARDSYREALRLARTNVNDISSVFLAGHETNLGLALMRLRDYGAAYRAFESALLVHPGFPQAYYNAFCCASIERNATRLAEWCGRMRERVTHDMIADDIDAVIDRIDSDEDLVWAREQAIFRKLIDTLRAELRRRQDRR